MAATIKDVAKMADCSIKTVSRVMNNEPYVTPELRARVMEAVRKVGYAPNISARRLVQNKSYMVCILMYPGFHQPASAILSRIMDITFDEDYDILIQTYFPSNSNSRNKLVNLIGERHMDGFVTTPPCDADGFVGDLLRTYKVPLVQISPIQPAESIPFVAGDDVEGAYRMTEHLIELGHLRIAFLAGPRNMRSSFDRLSGYHGALAAHNLSIEPDLVEHSEFTFDGGYTAARILMDKTDPPTAIFAGNDEAAYGALFAAQEMGLKIPGDLSICGYDDLMMSKAIWPGLTTVHQPADEMIEIATRMLIQIVKGEKLQNRQVSVSAQLVIRGSTGRPT